MLHPHTPFQGGWDFEPSSASCSHSIHLIDAKPLVLILGPMGLHRKGSVCPNQRTPVSCQIQNLIQTPWGEYLFVVRFITKFGESLPPYQINSAQVLQSMLGELGSGAANRSMNPELICPPYILWPRRVRTGSDPSSPDPRPVIVRPTTRRRAISAVVARRATHRRTISAVVVCRTTRRCAISAVVARATPVVARPCTRRRVLRTRRRPIFFKFPYPSSRTVHPSFRAVDPSSRAATRRCVLRTYCHALHTRRREVRNPSSQRFPRPPRTRPRQPYKYARVFLFPSTPVRASWPALATATTCGILHGVLTTFHCTSSTTTRI